MIENNFEHFWHKQTRLFLFKRGTLESLRIIYLINIASAFIFKMQQQLLFSQQQETKFLLRNIPTFRFILLSSPVCLLPRTQSISDGVLTVSVDRGVRTLATDLVLTLIFFNMCS